MTREQPFDPKPVTLVGNIVRLEPLTLEHAAGVLTSGADDSIWQFFSPPAPTNIIEAEAWIRGRLKDQSAGIRLPFAVICNDNGQFAGSTGYAGISRENRTLEIASWYGVAFQRTGVNTEGKYLLLKYAFEVGSSAVLLRKVF